MLFYLLISLVLFVFSRVAWARWKYDVHKIPSPRGWPLVGHGLHFISGKVKIEAARVRAQFFKELGYPKIMKASFPSWTWEERCAVGLCAAVEYVRKTPRLRRRRSHRQVLDFED